MRDMEIPVLPEVSLFIVDDRRLNEDKLSEIPVLPEASLFIVDYRRPQRGQVVRNNEEGGLREDYDEAGGLQKGQVFPFLTPCPR